MRMRNHNTSDRALVLGINPKCMDMHRIWGKTRSNYTDFGGGTTQGTQHSCMAVPESDHRLLVLARACSETAPGLRVAQLE